MQFITSSRQQWAESKILEEEVARRLERYLEAQLAVLLKEREEEFNAEVERRVAVEREALEKRRKEEAERKAREEEEEKRKKEVRMRIGLLHLISIILIHKLLNSQLLT